MPGAAFLTGDRLALTTVTTDDHEFLHEHWNAPAVRHGFARHEPRTREDFAAFLDRDDAVHFLVCRGETPVGFLWLFNVDDVAGRAELGYWVRPDEQGQGYATEAAALGLRYAFAERGLHKVLARVFETNDASRRVLENLGFEREGTLRDHYFVDGERVDATIHAVFGDG
jgi:RimJ/RimL family protein N-acetyltransferase